MRKLSLVDTVENACQACQRNTAFVVPDGYGTDSTVRALKYEESWLCITRHRIWLQEKILEMAPIEDGDIVIAYLACNSIDLLLSMIASTTPSISSCRHVTALLNFRWTPIEMANALRSQSSQQSMTIIVYGTGLEIMAKEVSERINHRTVCHPLPTFVVESMTPIVAPTNSPLKTQLPSEKLLIRSMINSGNEEDALIVFTSGTTGGSKGVRLSHRAIVIQSLAKLSEPCAYSGETIMPASTVPLFHVGGISSCVAVILAGGTLIFPTVPEPKFDAKLVKSLLAMPILPANTLVVVPAMLEAVLNVIDPSVIYENVRLVLIGGQAASKIMIDRLAMTFPNARIVQTYACTEAASSLTFLHVNATERIMQPASWPNRLANGDSVGFRPRHVHLRLYRKEGKTTNIISQPYQPGIIATRGPHLMNGYWERGSTEPFKRISGWYLTSDLGFFDERGQLYFCGRTKDVIRTGGENVMAQEVERIVSQHPAIAECAVFPREDGRFGEAVACAVVSDQPLELASIKEWCKKHGLANYKRPRYLFRIESLPKNSSGKVLKKELIASFGRRRSKL